MHYANSVSGQYSHCSIGTLLLDREANKIDTFPMFFMLLSKYGESVVVTFRGTLNPIEHFWRISKSSNYVSLSSPP